jgi:hypothetical protein
MYDHSKAMRDARKEGITLTPRGEPLFQRDMPRWREIIKRHSLPVDGDYDVPPVSPDEY